MKKIITDPTAIVLEIVTAAARPIGAAEILRRIETYCHRHRVELFNSEYPTMQSCFEIMYVDNLLQQDVHGRYFVEDDEEECGRSATDHHAVRSVAGRSGR